MGNERPALHLYTGDLLKDPLFRLCPWQAQNLWIRLLVHLHEMPHRGRFVRADGLTPLTDEEIAKLSDTPMADYMALSEILYSNHVASRIGGAMANRRMVRESQVIESKSNAGKLGAKSRWQNDGRAMANGNGEPMAGIAPSSSSMSSSSPTPNLQKDSTSEKEEGSGEEKDAQAPPAPTTAAAHECYSIEEIKGKWNGIPGVKPCAAITGVLATRINTLRKEHSPPWWDGLFTVVAASPFLLGKVTTVQGKPPFHANLPWVTGPINLSKVLAGNYLDHAPTKKKPEVAV